MSDMTILIFVLNVLSLIGVFALTFISSVLLHELGHLIVLRKHSKNARVYFTKENGKLKLAAGKESDYLGLSNKDLSEVYGSGIFLGIIPVGLFTVFNPWGLVLIIIYLAGCNSDFKKLKQIEKGE